MPKGHLNERGDLNIAALAIYAPLLVGCTWIIIKNGMSYVGFIYLLLLMISKLLHPALIALKKKKS
jgi:hypothetical protein